MTQEAEILRVFVASPSDVAPEREIVAKAVTELNRALGPSMGVRLEIVSWDTHVHPALGSDPQDIINRQIADDYEVFIGILWTRFGMPTPRAESGTLEEFQRAKERFDRDPESVSVMFYFKEEPLSPTEIDPEQLQRVQRFRRDLGKEGFYGTFSSEEEFGSNVRIHLTRILFERRDLRRRPSPLASPRDLSEVKEPEKAGQRPTSEEASDEDDESGLLDLVESGTKSIQQAGAVLERMTQNLQGLTASIGEASTDLDTVDVSKGGQEVIAAKRIINILADRLDGFADRIEAELTVFDAAYAEAMRAYGKAAFLMPDFGEGYEEALESNLEQLRGIAESIPLAREAILGLAASIERQPRVTTKFNRAKRKSQQALKNVDRQFSGAYTLTREVIGLLEAQVESAQKGTGS